MTGQNYQHNVNAGNEGMCLVFVRNTARNDMDSEVPLKIGGSLKRLDRRSILNRLPNCIRYSSVYLRESPTQHTFYSTPRPPSATHLVEVRVYDLNESHQILEFI